MQITQIVAWDLGHSIWARNIADYISNGNRSNMCNSSAVGSLWRRGLGLIVTVLGKDNRADSDREWPYVWQSGHENRPAKPTAAARADRFVTNQAVTRTVTHGPASGTRERHHRRRLHSLQSMRSCTGSLTRLAPAASASGSARISG